MENHKEIVIENWRLRIFNKVVKLCFLLYTPNLIFFNDLLASPKLVAIQDIRVFNTRSKSKRGHFVKYAKLQSRSRRGVSSSISDICL